MDTPNIFRIINAIGLAALLAAVWSISASLAEVKTDIAWIKHELKLEQRR
jgi:hypothetical protein